ncbi:MAG: hypothetical protein ACRYFX_31170 [Janthinobacterium lividum]
MSDNLDDLFRQKLADHATPPGEDLWARLQQAQPNAADEPLDAQFRAGLGDYATPPRREVWERLEDEHLRPRPRRRRPVVAWWQFAAAALLLFALLGGGLWRGGFLGHPVGDIVTIEANATQPQPASNPQLLPATQAASSPTTALALAAPEKNQEISATQATAPHSATSNTPIASTTRPRRPATTTPARARSHPQGQQPDATATQLAHAGGRNTPASQPALPVAPAPTPTLVATTTLQIIEVEVRRHSRPAASPAPAVVAATNTEPAPARRSRSRLGGLLRQAGRLAQGEQVSLADAAGLPDTLHVQTRIGSRMLAKAISL